VANNNQTYSNRPRPLLWGLEAVLFTFLAAFAGAALVQTRNYYLGWSAIAFSAVLNVVQVSIGLKLSGVVAIVANSFMVIFGRDAFLPSPVAGVSGVVATVLLALCLMNMASDD